MVPTVVVYGGEARQQPSGKRGCLAAMAVFCDVRCGVTLCFHGAVMRRDAM